MGKKNKYKQKDNKDNASQEQKAKPSSSEQTRHGVVGDDKPSTSQAAEVSKKINTAPQQTKNEEQTQQGQQRSEPTVSQTVQQKKPQQGQQRPQPSQQGQQRPQQAASKSAQQQLPQGQQWSQQGQQRPQQTASQTAYQEQQTQRQQWSQQGQQRPQQAASQPAYQEQQTQRQQWSQQGQQRPQQAASQRPQGQQGQQRAQGYQQAQQRPQQHGQQRPLEQKLSIKSTSNIPRGTIGQPGSAEVNYLRLDLNKMPKVAYHYDVSITPDKPKKFLHSVFLQFNRTCFPKIPIAFDGQKNAYTVQKLPDNEFSQEIEFAESATRTLKYKVTIKETDSLEVDLDSLRRYENEKIYDKPMRALQCIEVVMNSPMQGRSVKVGRSFYRQPSTKYDLDDGFEMWTGIYQAAILGDEPFLNVDVSHKSFPSECTILDLLKRYRDVNFNMKLGSWALSDLRNHLKGLNVTYTPPPSFAVAAKTFKYIDVIDESASKLQFELEDGKKLTVADYFASKNYKLKYPNLNCLRVGSTIKKVYLPIEFLSISGGQASNKKDGARQVQQMIRYSATSTDDRKRKIFDMLNYFEHNKNAIVRSFGIQIGSNFIEVPTRLLKAPLLEYLSRQTSSPFNGSWRLQDNVKFFATKQQNNGFKWAILSHERGRIPFDKLKEFGNMLKKGADSRNLILAQQFDVLTYRNIADTLRKLREDKYDLVVVVIPGSGTTYAEIKQSAELRVGILTQCIKENTIQRRLDFQLILNLLLKINAKLNGTNHKIENKSQISLQKVMFLGADVTHPSPDQRELPSIVGVAASHDANGACYNMQYRLQQSSLECIEDMASIIKHHLMVYKAYQNAFPDHIIYYRDGVSDGEFPKIKRNELGAIRSICQQLQIKPKITCIIVVKRHHTRFFPTVKGRDKFNNVAPGTVVDRTIVHPNESQFFMVSHQSIQGTAKPTRYNIIDDDAKMNIDDVQTLTYNMCHLFPRCNRAVSYPAPAYLAHLVAFRGRVYLEGKKLGNDLKREYNNNTIKDEIMTKNPMYFV